MPDLTDRLDEIAARAEAAGEGPWAANGDSPYWENSVADPGGWPIGERMYRDDAAFIAASRTDVPALVAALRAVLDLHHRVDVGVILGDCAWEDCGHEGACPEVPFAVCDACHSIADQIDPYLYERSGVDVVAWPCPTVRAVTAALGGAA